MSNLNSSGEAANVDKKVVKKKVAIFLGYNGSGFQGMQVNPNATTIEGTLWKALCACDAIHPSNSNDPTKVSWMRACRTDKGVHAAGQVVSLKMEMLQSDMTPLIQKALFSLSPAIRVYGAVEAASSFHSKERCDSRIYQYVLPTYVFAELLPGDFFKTTDEEESKSLEDSCDEEELVKTNGEDSLYTKFSTSADDLTKIRAFRLSPDRLAFLSALLQAFQGTHSFHNFTPPRAIKENSPQRYIRSVTLHNPFSMTPSANGDNGDSPLLFVDGEGVEWASIRLHGQSFLLHQIRKMVGLVIWAMKLSPKPHPKLILALTAKGTKHNVPKAPSLGLFLDHALFEGYNKKFVKEGRAPLDFIQEPWLSHKEACIQELILPDILKKESEGRVFWGWMESMRLHAHDLRYIIDVQARENEIPKKRP